MCNLRILTHINWTTGGTLRDRVEQELSQAGFSHLFTQTDFEHYSRERRNERRRQKLTPNPSHDALIIARNWIEDSPQVQSDFDEYQILINF